MDARWQLPSQPMHPHGSGALGHDTARSPETYLRAQKYSSVPLGKHKEYSTRSISTPRTKAAIWSFRPILMSVWPRHPTTAAHKSCDAATTIRAVAAVEADDDLQGWTAIQRLPEKSAHRLRTHLSKNVVDRRVEPVHHAYRQRPVLLPQVTHRKTVTSAQLCSHRPDPGLTPDSIPNHQAPYSS